MELPDCLVETYDLRTVHWIRNNLVSLYELMAEDDPKEVDDITKVKSFLTKVIKSNGKITATYRKSDKLGIGRSYAYGGSLQNIPKKIRGILSRGRTVDIDMVNCHPVILQHVCSVNNIPCPELSLYCKERNSLIDLKAVKDKQIVCIMINYNKALGSTPFEKKLDLEIKYIQKRLADLDEFKPILDSIEAKKNKIGCFMSLLLQSVENRILTVVYGLLQNVEVLMFDGLMVRGEFNNCAMLETAVKDAIGIDMKFAIKPHDMTYSVPDDFVMDDPASVYESLKTYYETTFKLAFIVDIVSYSYYNGNNLIFYNRDQIKQILIPIKIGEKRFIDMWIDDEGRRTYRTVDMIPHDRKCPVDVLNIWTGFAVESIKTYTTVDIAPILNHIKIQMNHNEACYEFMLDWLANIFQYPSSTSVLVAISTEKGGTGKGMLIDIIKSMIGMEKYHLVDDVSNRLFSRFNGYLQGKVMCHLDEVSAKDMNPYYERLKSMITNSTIPIEDKGQKTITVSNILKFISTSQHLQAFKIKGGDRRIWSVEGSEELRGNIEYFDGLLKIIQNPDYQRSFYDFLMERKVKQQLTHKDFPVTDLMKEAEILNRDPVEDFANELPTGERLYADELYTHYKQFMQKSGMEYTINAKQFAMKIKRVIEDKIEKEGRSDTTVDEKRVTRKYIVLK